MDSEQRKLPASLIIARPPSQGRVKRATSSLTLDAGLRSWAEGRYAPHSSIHLAVPSASQSLKPPPSPWLAWKKGAVLPSSSIDASTATDATSAFTEEPVELPAFDSRSDTRHDQRHSGYVISPLSVHRRSLESGLTVSRQASSRRRASAISSLNDRYSSYSVTNSVGSDDSLSVAIRNLIAPRSSPVHTRFRDVSDSRSETAPPMITRAPVNTQTIPRTEVEPVVSPVDVALFAAATGSLDFSFPSTPSPIQPPHALIHTQSSPPANSSSSTNSSLLRPLQPTLSQRSRSVPPRSIPQRHETRPVSGSYAAQLSAAVREPSNTLLFLESLGMDESAVDDDDELPDYETSQAEAHAARREEATRRARELELSWQQSWRRGRMR